MFSIEIKRHELYRYSKFGLLYCFRYNARWAMPSRSSAGVANMWYSWNQGPVHFISLNTETDFPGAAEEHVGDSGDKSLPAGGFGATGEYLEWLAKDLEEASLARSVRPWIIVGGHRPFTELEATIGAMFEQHTVDLYVAGHTHWYDRSFPIISPHNFISLGNISNILRYFNEKPLHNNRKCGWHRYDRSFPTTGGKVDVQPVSHYHMPNGTTHIVAGGAGCDEMKASTSACYHTFGLLPLSFK